MKNKKYLAAGVVAVVVVAALAYFGFSASQGQGSLFRFAPSFNAPSVNTELRQPVSTQQLLQRQIGNTGWNEDCEPRSCPDGSIAGPPTCICPQPKGSSPETQLNPSQIDHHIRW